MTVQSHATVSELSKLLERISLPTSDIPDGKRIILVRPLCRKRKRMSLIETIELDGNKRMCMLPVTRELPEEVFQLEILTRLPIKSVVRFKCVCKSWLSLFSDRLFVKHHNDHQNHNDYDCLVADDRNYIFTFSRYQQTFELPRDLFHYLIGSAKGLVCTNRNNIVSLWNPAIRQSKEFHLPSLANKCLKIGFGYDLVSNDYKVAICYRLCFLSNMYYAVYSSNSDSWIHHKFNDPDLEILVSISFTSYPLNPNTVVKDCPYWTYLTSSHENNIILSSLKFDAIGNEFKLLPEFSSECNIKSTYKVVNLKDLLTVMVYEQYPSAKLDIYSLVEKKRCDGWSKMYHFGPLQHFWRCGVLQQGFIYGDEIVFCEERKIYRYNDKTNTSEWIPGTKPVHLRNCYTYTPSLVSLQGMKSTYSEN